MKMLKILNLENNKLIDIPYNANKLNNLTIVNISKNNLC